MSDAGGSDPYVKLKIVPDTGLGLILDTMEAAEELGRPFTITLDVSSEKPKGDLHSLLGASATVTLSYPQKADRFFNGVVTRISYRGLSGGGYKYRIELRPWIWLLSQQQDCRIFQTKSAWTIMTEIFRDAGFTDFQDKRQNGSGDLSLDYCVQYRESTLDFVTRLMEQFGIYYYATHADGTHTIVFADDPNSHTAVSDAIPYEYHQTEWRTSEDHVWDWNGEAQIQPGAYTLREYNFTTPKADLTAKSLGAGGHTYGSNEVYDYPGLYETANDGQSAARVRMQDFSTRRQVYGGTSNSRKLGCGGKFTLSDFPDSLANQEYLITESICTVERTETRAFQQGDENIDTFRCVLRAVPGTRPFRLPNLTPRPLIQGPQTARVVGEQGQEVTTDQYGRIKVKFPWDRSTVEDQNASCWIRVAQVWAGKSWGGMVIPRIGQEVIVEFLEGNPDRPLVTGTVYNADQTVPYALPANKTRSTFKTNSSLNGGGFNEFRFEDKKGEEEVFFQAEKDFNEIIKANHTESIGDNTTTTVERGNRSYTIKAGTDLLKVEGDRTVELNSNDSLTVTSNRTTTIKGNHTVKVTGNEDYEVTGNQTTNIKGNETRHVTGASTINVDGGRTDVVKGGDDARTVRGANFNLTVAGGEAKIDASNKVTLVCGPSSIELAPSGITIKAPQISITADGDVNIKGMAASIEGTTKMDVSGMMTTVAGQMNLELSGGIGASLSAAMVKIN